ncbi:hypothetical protein ECANGB1_1643 [Enterospora canceri]|uniref:Uncharacterized protein n=1 Tax=Enterospora canceri TaxID=1081671 RepID=A0A1Y1S9U7_9MICR|nr:hypothetical protein ECANGB1_1643 [Enterospora canceri]
MKYIAGFQKEMSQRLLIHTVIFILKNTIIFMLHLPVKKTNTRSVKIFVVNKLSKLMMFNMMALAVFVYAMSNVDVQIYYTAFIALIFFYPMAVFTGIKILVIFRQFDLTVHYELVAMILFLMLFEVIITIDFHQKIGFISTSLISAYTSEAQLVEAYQKRQQLHGL